SDNGHCQDLVSVSLVCRDWSFIASDILWRQPLFTNMYTISRFVSTLESIRGIGARVRVLRFNESSIQNLDSRLLAESIQKIALNCRNVTSISFHSAFNRYMTTWFTGFGLENIQELYLCCTRKFTGQLIVELLNRCTRLQKLNIRTAS